MKEDWEEKVDFGYLNWYMKRLNLIKGKGVRIGVEQGKGIKPLELPLILNTTSTFYPDPDTETTSVDGYVGRNSVNETFSTIHNGAGTTSSDTGGIFISVAASTTSNQFEKILRGLEFFDTSSIPDTDTIDSATLSHYHNERATALDDANIAVVSGTAASDTALVNADYAVANFGSTEFITAYSIAGLTLNTYKDNTLNASGLAAISKTGLTKFGVMLSWDLANSFGGTWSSAAETYTGYRSADTAGTTQDPKLVVEHSAAATTGFMTTNSKFW